MWKNLNTKIVSQQMSRGKKGWGGNGNKANAEFNIHVEIIFNGNLRNAYDGSLGVF